LTDLEALILKGSRVTDTRVRDFERALPGVRVGR
jgi:hypothetical protein